MISRSREARERAWARTRLHKGEQADACRDKDLALILETLEDFAPPGCPGGVCCGCQTGYGRSREWAPPSRRFFTVRQPSQNRGLLHERGARIRPNLPTGGAEFLGDSPRAAHHDSNSKRSGGSSVGANTAEFLNVHCQRERLRFASVTARLATGPWPASDEWESLT
jgi:hypothetical protein